MFHLIFPFVFQKYPSLIQYSMENHVLCDWLLHGMNFIENKGKSYHWKKKKRNLNWKLAIQFVFCDFLPAFSFHLVVLTEY